MYLFLGIAVLIIVSTFFVGNKDVGEVEFKGKISRSYKDSEEWWPEPVKAPEGAPNVVIFLLDDTGFAQLGAYGGLIDTPNMDKLAKGGLLYTNFHTTALCSPSRASIMAGRNPHSIGLGSHSLSAMGFPGYNAMIPHSAKSVANILQKNGYVNYALGKWDHTPLYEVSSSGPFQRWPSGEGFDHYYGFMAADTDNFRPVLYSDHTPVEPWRGNPDYHLSEDMADKAIEYVTGHVSITPDKPFMMFFAPVAMHSPHQAPQKYIDRYKGKFDMGWDKAREIILKNQKELGILPAHTNLSSRPKEVPAWDSLSREEKELYEKQMEVFAGMLTHMDEQIGRVIAMLERVGKLDDTLIILTSDNGASGEGGLAGTFNETYVLNGLQTPLEVNLEHMDEWGGRYTYPHYHAGWAMAGNTPFKYFKQSVHRGGIQDPLIMHWPKGIKARGELRHQYHHIADIAPTILEVASLEVPDTLDGYKQQPMDGVSVAYTFDNPKAPNKKHIQYYEMFGNRSIWKDGWKAVVLHGKRMPWILNAVLPFEDDEWELYHVAEDPSESNNLAKKYPKKLEELKKAFDEEAWKYNVYPLHDDMLQRIAKQQTRLFGDRKVFTYYYPGAKRIGEKAGPPLKDIAHKIETTIDLKGREEGVIVACGGMTGGYTMFIKNGKLYFDYNYFNGVYYTLESPRLPRGKTDLKFNFIKTGPWKGIGELYVNGKLVDKVEMPKTHISTFSLGETFDVGVDHGTPVSAHYKDEFKFKGDLDKVVITLTE